MYQEKLKVSFEWIKKNSNVFLLYAVIMTLYFGIAWVFNTKSMMEVYSANSVQKYLKIVVIDTYLPELFTCMILAALARRYHTIIKNNIDLSPKSIFLYEIKFIPLILISYVFYAPITITIRFLLIELPNYSFDIYLKNYIVDGLLSWKVYLKYVFFSAIFVYVLINISLIEDILFEKYEFSVIHNDNLKKEEEPQVTPKENIMPISQKQYITSIRGKDARGDLIFPVEECLWFETSGGTGDYYAMHTKGKFRISVSLNDLEEDLDPKRFFRVNRKQIINLEHLKTFAYWQYGKYILRLDSQGVIVEFIMARARLNDLKDRLSKKKK